MESSLLNLKLNSTNNQAKENKAKLPYKKTAYTNIIEEKSEERLQKARQLFKNGQLEQAVAEYTKVLFLKPDSSEVFKEFGDIYCHIQDISSAIMMYKKSNQLKYSLQIEEKLKDLIFKKGFMLLEQGEYNDFLEGTQYESFSYTLQISLQQIYEEDEIKKNKGLPQFVRALAFATSNNKVYALQELDQTIKIQPNYINALLLKGKLLWSQNKHAEGNEYFWKVEQLEAQHPEIQEFLKMIVPKADELLKETRHLLVQNQNEKCLLNVKKGLELFPNNTQFLLIKSFIFRKQGEYENSLNNLLLAFHTLRDQQMELEVKNQIALTYNEMGTVLFKREQYEEAITLFNESLQFKANDWGVLANRGDCYRAQNKIDDALKDYLRAQKQVANNQDINTRIAIIRHSRGIILFNAKKYQKALKEFDEAIKLQTGVANFYHNRAKCLLQLDNLNEALGDLLKCHELDPSNYEVATLVKRLKEDQNAKKKKNVIFINKDD